jgi:hypothetical protein
MVGNVDGSAYTLTPDWDRGSCARSDGRALTPPPEQPAKLFEIDARTSAVRAVTEKGTVSALTRRGPASRRRKASAARPVVDASGGAARP